jgi:hypothetical protein
VKGIRKMALREVTVEVEAKFTVKVLTDNGREAVNKAKEAVLSGSATPEITDWVIIDVKPINETF